MFKKILLPTDGSAIALQAAQTVANMIAPSDETQVSIILVIEPMKADETDYDEEIVVRHNAKMRDRAEAALATTARVFAELGVKHETHIVEGDPVSVAIAREAEAGHHDVIAMGSRGMGMQKNNMHYLGSVTEHVIRRVNVPVLVVPTHKD